MKRIIYIANVRIPTEKAHGIQIMKMCESFALSNPGNVELIVPNRFNPIKEDAFAYYRVKKNFKITKIPCFDLIPLDKYLGRVSLWIQALSFSFFVFPYLFFKKADIIYTRNKFLLFLCFFKKKIIFEAHVFPKNYSLYSLFFKKIKGMVVITKKLKDLFRKAGILEHKILVAPDAVDLEKFDLKENREECRKRLNLSFDKKIVLYAGHLYKWKGADVLAQVSEYLPRDVSIYFVGGTDKDIKEFKNKNSKFKVQVVGHRPHSEIPYWLKAADILVLPNTAEENISKYWTSPIKMFEYMAAKRPIIASDLPSIREILNEKNALLVNSDNSKDLARGIRKILENPELATKILTQAFKDVQGYTWQKRAKIILNFIYGQII